MSKTIILSEEKFNRIIRKTLKEEDVYNNYEAFKSQREGGGDGTPEHNVSTVGGPEDETNYGDEIFDIENPRL